MIVSPASIIIHTTNTKSTILNPKPLYSAHVPFHKHLEGTIEALLKKGGRQAVDPLRNREKEKEEREMAKRLLPSFNRVLVEKILPPSKTSSGIILPEKTTKLNSGKVVAVGPGGRDRDGKHVPLSFKEGDTVLLPEYGGTQVKIDDKEYHLFMDDDILGTLHD